jgi:hypothetical protein
MAKVSHIFRSCPGQIQNSFEKSENSTRFAEQFLLLLAAWSIAVDIILSLICLARLDSLDS